MSGASAPEGAFTAQARAAVYEVIARLGDRPVGFTGAPVSDEVLTRILEAAHRAPSLGPPQPWDFLVLTGQRQRRRIRDLAQAQRTDRLKSTGGRPSTPQEEVEAIASSSLNLVVTCDPTRGGPDSRGRYADAGSAAVSAALAVQNLCLAARAEGIGAGWVSFVDTDELVDELGLPPYLEVVAYLCLGPVESFPEAPDTEPGVLARRPLSWAVHHGSWGVRHLPGGEPVSLIEETIRAIEPPSAEAMTEARERQRELAKPAGSLGQLEDLAVRLCGAYAVCPPPVPQPVAVAVFAGDHGIHAQGVSRWPQEFTTQMTGNIVAGGAVVNALGRQVGAEVTVVDVGVVGEVESAPGLVPRRVRPGTADMTEGPALSEDEVVRAVEVGIEVARDLVVRGTRLLVAGDVGAANTTVSAALVSALTGHDPAAVTGRGSGVGDGPLARKVEVVRAALAANADVVADREPLATLGAVGGLEHAAVAGFLLGAASLRTPVVLDGMLACSAALVATGLAPESVHYWIAGHRSVEPGASVALDHLGLTPLVDLGLHLGEGAGATLAVPLVQAAARVLTEVATFDAAGVTPKVDEVATRTLWDPPEAGNAVPDAQTESVQAGTDPPAAVKEG